MPNTEALPQRAPACLSCSDHSPGNGGCHCDASPSSALALASVCLCMRICVPGWGSATLVLSSCCCTGAWGRWCQGRLWEWDCLPQAALNPDSFDLSTSLSRLSSLGQVGEEHASDHEVCTLDCSYHWIMDWMVWAVIRSHGAGDSVR